MIDLILETPGGGRLGDDRRGAGRAPRLRFSAGGASGGVGVRRLVAVLVWSVIAAAFIGPGTVTTCAAAGVEHRYALLWALAFSTVATLVLQEASARLAVVSGRDLAAALRERAGAGGPGVGAALVLLLVLGAVVVGCAAYEAGNILGAVAGAALAVALPAPLLTIAIVALAAALLAAGSPRRVALLLSALVAVMGVAFLVTAVLLSPPAVELLTGLVVPSLPAGSGLLVLGLVGTTVVPYNLFLGSGLARGQALAEIRFGLAVAVLLGGVISMGIVVVGAAVPGPFGFPALAAVLARRLGAWAGGLFAWGLFAAGLSSAVTAPLAAALTARGLFARSDAAGGEVEGRWRDRGWRFRAVWIGVLATGLGFGLSGIRPVPVILLAQALNGVLLPVAALFLLLAVNDRRLVGVRGLNGPLSNTAMAAVVFVTLVLGLTQLARASEAAFGWPALDEPAVAHRRRNRRRGPRSSASGAAAASEGVKHQPLPQVATKFITAVLCAHGTGAIEAHGPGSDLRAGRGQAPSRLGSRIGPGVGCGGREDRRPPGGPLHLRGGPPGAVRDAAGAAHARGAEGGDPALRAKASCAPLTPTSWCA